MTGKLQFVILSFALALGANGFDRAMDVAAHNSRLLHAAAQYKLFVGDAETAMRLLQQAENSEAKQAPQHSRDTRAEASQQCPNATKG